MTTRLGAVADTLATQQGLLVLDTCEHVLAAAGQLATTVLRTAPNVRILATSRRALGLTGELAWPVPPLALPPVEAASASEITSHAAVQLFVERALAVNPDLHVDDRTAADVAAICQTLDGLPLAIELAAARTDLLSPTAIRERLTDRFDLLVGGGVDAAERQQTLRAAIDWSFELLTERAADVLRPSRRVRRDLRPRRRPRGGRLTGSRNRSSCWGPS